MSKDIFSNLVTDITAQVLEQVQQQVATTVSTAVNDRLASLIDNGYISGTIEERINTAILQYHPNMTVVEQNLKTLTDQWAGLISADLDKRVEKILREQVKSVDLNELINRHISTKLDPRNLYYPFPEKSIDGKALKTDTLSISGDCIQGGVIKNFGSTGIDDQSTGCKVTILDKGTVFENTLFAPRIEIKGGAEIDGDLDIKGRIIDSPAYQQLVADVAASTQTALTDDVLRSHQNVIFNRIQNEGIDLTKVTFNGKILIDNDRLVGVVNSQLRTVGVLQDLQTMGDTFLSDTMYVAGKRVGVNTMEPKSALSIWDEEIEFSVGKHQRGVGKLSVEKENDFILSCNDKDNITLNKDGSTKIPKLQINNMVFTSGSAPPNYDAPKGMVVFNENPSLGGPLGWVSLGEARWANFGIID